jgi:hypothetical protein
VSRVQWDQRQLRTDVTIANWYAPTGPLGDGRTIREAELGLGGPGGAGGSASAGGDYPNQGQAGEKRKAVGESGSAQLVTPIQPVHLDTPRPAVVRMKVVNGSAAANVLTAQRTDTGQTDIPVRSHQAHSAAQELLAVIPAGGVTGGILYNGAAVAWEELAPDGPPAVVRLTQNGGSNGDKTAAPTYTYDVASLDGRSLAGKQTPVVSRPKGRVTAAAWGLAIWLNGTFVLLYAFEVPGSAACS